MTKPPPAIEPADRPPRKRPTPINISTIHRPLPNCSLWSGTAQSSRRRYEWFAHADGSILFVRAQHPGGGFYDMARTPPHMRRTILAAISNATPEANQ